MDRCEQCKPIWKCREPWTPLFPGRFKTTMGKEELISVKIKDCKIRKLTNEIKKIVARACPPRF